MQGCNTYYTSHEQFIESMDALSDGTATLSQLADPKYTGSEPASRKYFKRKESTGKAESKYYYSKPSLWGGNCHYYFLVNENTKKVVSWGFDYDAGDPKKYCGASG